MTRKVEKLKEAAATTAIARQGSATREVKHTESILMLGAVGAFNSLTDKLGAQTIRALEAFGEEKGYEAFGFTTFAEFLDKSPYSPMTKHQFYERKQALHAEGDVAYNLLNSLRVPISTRKLLKGQVSLDGDKIHIGQKDDEQVVSINDHPRITEIITTLVNKTAEQQRTIERGTKENKNLKKKLDAAKQSGATGGSPYEQALLNLLGAFTALRLEAEKLDEDEREEKLATTLPQIANQRLLLEEAFGLQQTKRNGKHHHMPAATVSDEIGENM